MQTLNREKISQAFKIYLADKPNLSRRLDIFEESEEELSIYSAFTGSVHEVPSRNRYARTKSTKNDGPVSTTKPGV